MEVSSQFAFLSGWSVLAKCLIVLPALYVFQLFVYAYAFSPVRHIPGPWYARISGIPRTISIYNGKRTAYASNLLRKYGSIVVIAPDQIHTNDEKAMSIIYNRKSAKSKLYARLGDWKGTKSILARLDYPSAKLPRKFLMSCFQSERLKTLTDNIGSHIWQSVDVIRTKLNQDVNAFTISQPLALDIVSDVLWGEQDRLLSAVDAPGASEFANRVRALLQYNTRAGFLPGFVFYVNWFSPKWRAIRDKCYELDLTAKERLERWELGTHDTRERDVLSMLRAMENKEPALGEDIPALLVEMLAAGSGTTALTIAIILWQLAQHPQEQKLLRDELIKAFPEKNKIDFRKTMDLPYVDAVIRETMRWLPNVPGPQERRLGDPLEVEGFLVPPGVIASTSPWDQARLASVYPEPDMWEPERWLRGVTERMSQNWIPFGYGSRACPGENLAMTELKYIIGTLLRHFGVVPPKQHDGWDEMELWDVFLLDFNQGQCWVRFEEVE